MQHYRLSKQVISIIYIFTFVYVISFSNHSKVHRSRLGQSHIHCFSVSTCSITVDVMSYMTAHYICTHSWLITSTMMDETFSKTLNFCNPKLTWLIAHEDLIVFSWQESFKSNIMCRILITVNHFIGGSWKPVQSGHQTEVMRVFIVRW